MFINKVFLIVIILLCNTVLSSAQGKVLSLQTKKLLSHLNLNTAALKSVKAESDDPAKAAKELLKYFKNRTSVKHLVNNVSAEKVTEKDLKWANDALRHIFVGQPAYQSFFCGDDIDWSSRPVQDNEWFWQLNRMYFWNSMAKVYRQTGDEKYAKEWGRQLIDWTNKNPNDEKHKYAWRSIEAGIRGYSWTGLFYSFIHSPNFTPEVLVAFLNSCYDHAEYLMTVYRSGSNWALMEAEGLAFIAINFPEFKDAEKWKKEAVYRLNREINIQVYPDGHQRELAIGYHLGSIRWFLRTYELAKLNGVEDAFPPSYLKTIEKMCEVPMKIGLPDGTNVQFGDSWQGKPGQHDKLFLEWSKLFGRKDFLYLATGGKQGTEPDKTAYALKQSGFYSMRSGWDKNAVCLVLKCGPNGGGHSQPDNGTFTLYAGGRNLMPDAGSYIYSGDPEGRNWFRQTKVHQTLTLNGENTRYEPKLLKWEPGKDLYILVVENGSYEDLTHRRAVYFVDKKYFVIVDEAIGTATGDVDIHFQLAPGGAVFNNDDFSVHSGFAVGWNVFVQTQKQKGLELTKEEGWVSFEYTKKEPRPAFRFRLKKVSKSDTVRFVTVVVPYENEVPEVDIDVKEGKDKNSGLLQINVNGTKKNIEYSL